MPGITELQETLGVRLRRHRKLAGWSQEALAKALSVDRSLVSRWESGSRAPGLWEALRAARALEIPVSALVIGSAALGGGNEVVWQELTFHGAPFATAGTKPLWSVRPIHETIADALVHPTPRVIDRLPGLLLLEDFSARALWGLCADSEVEFRMGWIADIALWLARDSAIATKALRIRALQTALDLARRPDRDAPLDSLGFAAEEPDGLPPIFNRWRISYAGELKQFEAAAEELELARRKGPGW